MNIISRKILALATVVLILIVGSVVLAPAADAVPTTFTVNVTTDASDAMPGDGMCETLVSSECSLRAAIEEANANAGADTIEFNIPGSGVHTISPSTALPAMTEQTTIDGYSQPGSSANTAESPNPMNSVLRIELSGDALSAHGYGLAFTAADSVVRGISIFGFSGLSGGMPDSANIYVDAPDFSILGSYVGVRADGMTVGPGDNSLGISGSGNAAGMIVGSALPSDRNIFFSLSESNQSSAIIVGSGLMTVYGNYFGIGRDGITDFTPEDVGGTGFEGPYSMNMNLLGSNDFGGSVIGGPSVGQRNVLSGGTNQLIISSNGNIVQGNYIGTDYTGQPNPAITNGIGIAAATGTNNLVGGTNPGEGNVIAGVHGMGVMLALFHIEEFNFDIPGPQVALLGNAISDIDIYDYPLFGDSNQAIDFIRLTDTSVPADFSPEIFESQGPTLNDGGDGDVGPNDLMNFPVLKSAVQSGSGVTVNYDLDVVGADGSGLYRVEFFANDISTIFGYGPGQTYIGSATTTNGANKTVTLNVGSTDLVRKALSATVTPIDAALSNGHGGTSEFAQNILIGSDTDWDADGVTNVIEQSASNGGDGNGDSILDYMQPTVASYAVNGTTTRVTFETTGCYATDSIASLPAASLPENDSGFDYPFGLTDFTLNCSRGNTVDVKKYIFTNVSADEFSVRKYRPATHTYEEVPGSSITQESIGSASALKISYSITDGGSLDDDGVANGVIVDPFGIAVPQDSEAASTVDNTAAATASASGLLPATGATGLHEILIYGFGFIVFGFFVILTNRRGCTIIRYMSHARQT